MMQLRSAALSDIGRVRRKNEDRFLQDPAAGLFGVADGVGGLPGGAEAAQNSVDEVTARLHAMSNGEPPDLAKIVEGVNQHVRVLGRTVSPATGIGSTLTFGYFRNGTVHLAHVGDSRCYAWRNGEFSQLTEDHSVENEARQRRARGEVVYYHEANRNALTRCIGQPGTPEVDVLHRPLLAGDRYLFCTDGVTRLIRDHELGDMVAKSGEPEKLLREIIDLAVRRGGPDNATGVLVFVDEA
ncbi:MAG TPA: protein phosphatase 2C domain-containing protein [Opitutus sp.]|nr:protein phosphatase 2C domain-containing protein [Opitutus sp.]